MRYYSEKYVRNIHFIPTEYKEPQIVNIRFCRNCPYFISDYIPDEVRRYGSWCEYRSEGEEGWHYDVTEDSFCNEDDIIDVY